MPTYQYTCTECGESLEAVQRISDPALTECPRCGGRLRKVFPAVGVVFKGSGFYRTDSRSAKSKAETSPSGNGASSESTKAPAESSNGSRSKTPAASASTSSSSGSTD